MKKSELTMLTQIIEHMVAKEVKRLLPSMISEALSNEGKLPISEATSPNISEQTPDIKSSLKELFAGTPVFKQESTAPVTRQFTKNPVLNQILNETRGDLRERERMVGGGFAPVLSAMPEATPAMLNDISIRKAPTLVEGQSSNHAPLSDIPQGISVLDVAKHVPLEPATKKALTRDYSEMMKIMNKKKKV